MNKKYLSYLPDELKELLWIWNEFQNVSPEEKIILFGTYYNTFFHIEKYIDIRKLQNKKFYSDILKTKNIRFVKWMTETINNDDDDNDNCIYACSSVADAVQSGNIEIVKKTIYAGADIHEDYDDALCYAADTGNIEIVELLNDAGADVECGFALYLAARNGHTDIVRFLVCMGANIRNANEDGALRSATENGYTEIIKILSGCIRNPELFKHSMKHHSIQSYIKNYVVQPIDINRCSV